MGVAEVKVKGIDWRRIVNQSLPTYVEAANLQLAADLYYLIITWAFSLIIPNTDVPR